MTRNPNIERAARVIAATIVHGSSPDIAREIATALDDAGLLDRTAAYDPFAVGRASAAPSPEALAVAAQCRRAKAAADAARAEVVDLPGVPEVSAAGGEVTFVVHPRCLTDWKRWTLALGVEDAQSHSTGSAVTARFTYRGVRARLIGVGVPELLRSALSTSRTAAAR
ncbi:hypothetical protein AB0H29_08200 [Streptomyces thermolilacinus]